MNVNALTAGAESLLASLHTPAAPAHNAPNNAPDPGARGQPQAAPELADEAALTSGAATAVRVLRAQFEVNYQSLRAVAGEDGAQFESVQFSLRASYEFAQVSTGAPAAQAPEGDALLDRVLELFSPENTAQRILDFALARYAPEGEDSESARAAFAEWIGEAIQKGFDEALGMLGDLPDEVQEQVDRTHELVFDGLDDFVATGRSQADGDDAQSAVAGLQAWAFSVQLEYSSLRATYGPDGTLPESAPNEEAAAFQALA